MSGDQLVLGGGDGTSQLAQDVWALSLPAPETWTRIETDTSPPGRLAHSAIRDGAGDRMIVFGGSSMGTLDDTWALSLADPHVWTELATTGTPPSPRADHAAVHDPMRDRMIVFGGDSTNETWELALDGSLQWSPVATTGGPPPGRLSHTAIHDPLRDRMIVFGGAEPTSLLNDVWALSLSTHVWTELEPSGTAPGGRRDHVAVHDPGHDQMIVYGGNNNFSPFLNDVWTLSLGNPPTWTEIFPSGPVPEGPITHAGLFDPARDRLIAFGGSYHHEVWALSLEPSPSWALLSPGGFPPTGRVDHTVVHDPVRDRMVVFSGHSGLTMLGDVWILDWAATTGIGRDVARSPGRLRAWPNPARSATAISFSVGSTERVRAGVYDLRGRLVRGLVDRTFPAGDHALAWTGEDAAGRPVPSGVYFLRLDSGNHVETVKITWLR